MLTPEEQEKKKKTQRHNETRLWILAYAYESFKQAKITAENFISQGIKKEDPLFHTFISSIATTYSRMFITNDLGTLSEKKFGKFGNPDLGKTHKALLQVRNTFYAHCDTGDIGELNITGRIEKSQLVYGYVFHEVLISERIITDTIPLCEHQIITTSREIEAVIQFLYPEKTMLTIIRGGYSDATAIKIKYPKLNNDKPANP